MAGPRTRLDFSFQGQHRKLLNSTTDHPRSMPLVAHPPTIFDRDDPLSRQQYLPSRSSQDFCE